MVGIRIGRKDCLVGNRWTIDANVVSPPTASKQEKQNVLLNSVNSEIFIHA